MQLRRRSTSCCVLDGVRVIAMLTVPVYAAKQNEVNLILRNAAATNRIVLVDWEGYTRLVPAVLSNDDVHPTTYGADVIAQLIGLTLGRAPEAIRTYRCRSSARARTRSCGPGGEQGRVRPE